MELLLRGSFTGCRPPCTGSHTSPEGGQAKQALTDGANEPALDRFRGLEGRSLRRARGGRVAALQAPDLAVSPCLPLLDFAYAFVVVLIHDLLVASRAVHGGSDLL